ncbi:MAG: TonB-dependent receptor [Balneolaceae bacterium]|nr:TonB-dependent receptor [Balneolaceae bacterium]
MNSLKYVLIILISIVFTIPSLAQTGEIEGKVIDSSTGESIIGANILVMGTDQGTATDMEGEFELDVTPGTYDLRVSYISYAQQTVTGITVNSEEEVELTIRLQPQTSEMEEVVVAASALRNTEEAAITLQRRSPNMLNAISSEMFSNTGDDNAAAALKRVTGVSVEGGKYVYVRGLGDRYSKTTLNSATIPGLDPSRNTVQMDMFPTDLIEDIVVYKTFRPDLPGDFTGGLINMNTKAFPDEFSLKVSSSIGINTLASFNDNFLTYSGGKTDWLGFDDGTRKIIPANRIDGIPPTTARFGSNERAQQLTQMTQQLNNRWTPTPVNESQLFNQKYSISLGNQSTLFGKKLGYVASLSYDRNFSFYENGKTGFYVLTGNIDQVDKLSPDYIYEDAQGTENVLWGGLVSASLQLSPFSRISATFNRNQSGEKLTRYQEGPKPREADNVFVETRTQSWTERNINTFQLKGEHALNKRKNLTIKWNSTYTLSNQYQPDLRFFSNSLTVVNQDTIESINNSYVGDPRRFTRKMDEFNFDNQIDLELNTNLWGGRSAKFKIGGKYLLKERDFRENAVAFSKNGNSYAGSPETHISDSNVYDRPGNTSDQNIFVVDYYQQRNNYDGEQSVWAGYAMAELPVTSSLRAVFGIRMEDTDMQVTSFDPTKPEGDINNVDLLPSVNLNYALNDQMNLRAAYSKTIARPSFREIAPYTSFSFDTEPSLVGSPLNRTKVDNMDLRWELFPSSQELFSIGVFYKRFENPIEKTISPASQDNDPIFTFRNVDNARLYGAEVEFRKTLDFISPSLSNFRFGTNFSIIQSETEIPQAELNIIRSNIPNADDTRDMFGQSDYTINSFIQYVNKKGTEANINFNVQGERIVAISTEGTPNVEEQPYPLLGVDVKQHIGRNITLKASGSNLLNSVREQTYDFKGDEYYFYRAPQGMSFSVGVTYGF